jgi:hypothetical protein
MQAEKYSIQASDKSSAAAQAEGSPETHGKLNALIVN